MKFAASLMGNLINRYSVNCWIRQNFSLVAYVTEIKIHQLNLSGFCPVSKLILYVFSSCIVGYLFDLLDISIRLLCFKWINMNCRIPNVYKFN